MTNGPVFTDEEWEEFFGDTREEAERPPRHTRSAKLVAFLIATAMLVSGAAALLTGRGETDTTTLSDRATVQAFADDVVDRSGWDWLVTEIVVESIPDPSVAGFVRRPGDGIIFIDDRAWSASALRSTVVHEIGHLIAFAAYGDDDPEPGGLETEVWAECAAASASARFLDDDDDTQEYRCTAAELATFNERLGRIEEICRPWGTPECRDL